MDDIDLTNTQQYLLYYFRGPKKLTGFMIKPWTLAADFDEVTDFVKFYTEAGLLQVPQGSKVLRAFNVKDLKNILRGHKLKLSGKKDVLIKRIMDSIDIAPYIPKDNNQYLVSTDLGDEIGRRWKEVHEKRCEDVFDEVKTLVQSKKYQEAIKTQVTFTKQYEPQAFTYDDGEDHQVVIDVGKITDKILEGHSVDEATNGQVYSETTQIEPGYNDPNDYSIDERVKLLWDTMKENFKLLRESDSILGRSGDELEQNINLWALHRINLFRPSKQETEIIRKINDFLLEHKMSRLENEDYT